MQTRTLRSLHARSWAVAALALGLSVSLGAQEPDWELAAPAPEIPLMPRGLEGTQTHECAECHAEVVAEWATSAHAIAWVDELYQKQMRERKRPELCHGCHAPEPLLAGGEPQRPKAREEHRQLGIDCRSCHLGHDGAMLGARGTATEAHASTSSPFFEGEGGSQACAACHSTNIGPVVGIAKDFFKSEQSQRGRSCAGCHMAWVERGVGPDGEPRRVRSHAIQTPRDPSFLRLAFELSLQERAGKTVVVIENRAGHRVPGLIGRELKFSVEAEGKTLADHSLDARRYLPVDGQATIELPQAAAKVRVRGTHLDPRAAEAMPFLDLELELER